MITVTAVDAGIIRRAGLHAALSEPVRLAIVEDLVVTDRSPKELGELFGLAPNLLAHHLRSLERVGLIERFVSAGDQRRRYVRLLRHSLGDLGVTTTRREGRMLFVCTHNSARSQLAAALWRKHTGGVAESAGTDPASEVHPGAVAAGHRVGLDLEAVAPRHVSQAGSTDRVVTVCDRAHEELPPDGSRWHWSIPDPVARGTARAFDAALSDLDLRIRALTEEMTP